MKNVNKIILFLFVLIVLATSLNASVNQVGTLVNFTNPNVSMVLPAVNQSGVLFGNFTVGLFNTTGNGTITFSATSFNGTSLQTNLSNIVGFNVSSIFLQANQTAVIPFNVTIPSRAYAENYSGFINATFNGSNFDFFRLSFVVDAQPNLSVQSASVRAIETFSNLTTFQINNSGNTDLSLINFTIGNITTGSASIPAANFSLNVTNGTNISFGKMIVAQLTFSPQSNQTAGTYSGPITFIFANRQLNATLTAIVEARSSSLTASIPSFGVIQGFSNSTVFNLTNNGNVNLTNINFTIGVATTGSVNFSGSSAISLNISNSTNLAIGESRAVQITSNAALNQTAGTYSGPITFIFDSKQTNITFATVVSAIGPSVSLSASGPSLVRNTTTKNVGNLTITIQNNGNINLSNVVVNIGNATSGSNVISTSAFSAATYTISSLPVNITNINNITLTLPNASVAAGTYSGIVNATYNNTFTTASYSFTVSNPTTSVSFSSLTFSATASQRNSTVKQNLTITNNGDTTLTNLKANSTLANLTFSTPTLTTLLSGQSANVTASFYISTTAETGKTTLGSFNVFADQLSGSSGSVILDMESNLDIIDVDVKVGGDSDNNLNDGDTIDVEAQPGDKVEFEIEIENTYTSTEDVDIKDVDVEIVIKDIDDGKDLDDEERNVDIRADDSEKFHFEFELPEDPKDLDEGNYDITIIAEGKDENGVTQKDEMELELEVKREDQDLRINVFALSQNPVSCNRQLVASITAQNYGSDDQEDVLVNVASGQLSLEESAVYDLDEEDTESRTFTFTIPDSTAAGTYLFAGNVYYEGGRKGKTDLADTESIQLTVQDCVQAATETTEQTTPAAASATSSSIVPGIVTSGIVQRPSTTTEPTLTAPVEEEQVPFTETTTYLVLLGSGIAVTSLMTIGLIVLLFI